MGSMFTRAVREKVALKVALTGPSGSGKTYSGLQLAFGLADGGRVAVLDTENGSANLYADLGVYDTVTLRPPYTAARYMEIIQAAQREGYSVLLIDSLTHLWAGDGGLLAQKEAKDARGGNSYTNWAEITRFFEQFKSAMLQSPMHVIATIRSKQDYVVETNTYGKQAPRKVGLAPIMRDGIEYEFTTVFDIDMSHMAAASKDRTKLFDSRSFVMTPAVGRELVDWLATGATPAQVTREELNAAIENEVAERPSYQPRQQQEAPEPVHAPAPPPAPAVKPSPQTAWLCIDGLQPEHHVANMEGRAQLITAEKLRAPDMARKSPMALFAKLPEGGWPADWPLPGEYGLTVIPTEQTTRGGERVWVVASQNGKPCIEPQRQATALEAQEAK